MDLEYCDRASIRLPNDVAVHDAAVHEAAVSSRPNILGADIRLQTHAGGAAAEAAVDAIVEAQSVAEVEFVAEAEVVVPLESVAEVASLTASWKSIPPSL